MPTLDDLVAVLYGPDDEPARATSLRLPERVHRATSLATALGMDPSVTAATSEALLDRVHRFVREQAIAAHLRAFPQDQPPLSAVVARRVSGSDHPAATRPELVTAVADWYAARHPDWALSGRVDDAVDRVLEQVEFLVETGTATPQTAV